MKRVPEIGEQLPFFDDGKYSLSRHYRAWVVDKISVEDAKKKTFWVEDDEDNINKFFKMTLYDLWKEEIDRHRNRDRFHVINKGSNGKPGTPWLYAEETDCFLVCAVPGYNDHLLYFARMVSGGWFSLEINSSWCGGLLDVDLDKFNGYKEDYPDVYNEYIKYYNGKK